MRLIFAFALIALAWPAPARAWGFDAHKFITEHMIALLPPALKPLFESRKAVLIERSVDPDLWRSVGWEAEPPNHFVDLDFFGKYPFSELPHEYDRAVEKYGRDVIHEQGTLPWRVQEFYGRLRRAFESVNRPNSYAVDDIVLFSAVLAHYIGDAHVPLHSVVNYDGQLTNQRGIHSRWESELFDRNRASLKIAPAPPAAVKDPREFAFDILLSSNRLSAGVLAADAKAAAGREFYDDAYFAALAVSERPVLEKRINDSITAVAAIIIGAWDAAGRPDVPLQRIRTPRRIPPPPAK